MDLAALIDGEFHPAIDFGAGEDQSGRLPAWHVVQVNPYLMALFVNVMDHRIRLPYVDLKFELKRPRQETVVRRWMPGYVFIEYDERVDHWQQLYRLPPVTHILGTLDPKDLERLKLRCPYTLPKNHKYTIIPRGTRVSIKRGPLQGQEATVSDSDSKKNEVTVELVVFARPLSVTLQARDVAVLG